MLAWFGIIALYTSLLTGTQTQLSADIRERTDSQKWNDKNYLLGLLIHFSSLILWNRHVLKRRKRNCVSTEQRKTFLWETLLTYLSRKRIRKYIPPPINEFSGECDSHLMRTSQCFWREWYINIATIFAFWLLTTLLWPVVN